jgi:hypothetical protein
MAEFSHEGWVVGGLLHHVFAHALEHVLNLAVGYLQLLERYWVDRPLRPVPSCAVLLGAVENATMLPCGALMEACPACSPALRALAGMLQ